MSQKTNGASIEELMAFTPVRKAGLVSSVNDKGLVVVHEERKGMGERFMQKVFRSPKYLYVTLEEVGSFIWPLLDGEHTVSAIGALLSEEFGQTVEPLYPRLVEYICSMANRGYVLWRPEERGEEKE